MQQFRVLSDICTLGMDDIYWCTVRPMLRSASRMCSLLNLTPLTHSKRLWSELTWHVLLLKARVQLGEAYIRLAKYVPRQD